MDTIQTIGIENMPIIKKGDNLARLICDAATKQDTPIQNNDIVVVTHIVVSRAEGRVVNLNEVTPSEFAKNMAGQHKDPAFVETVLRESKSIIRMIDGKLVTETKHGLVCANSGVDRSNVPGERNVVLLPNNPDFSATKIRKEIKRLTGCDVAVIISDTHGRPIRRGEINVAIGVSGIKPIRDRRGEEDLFGYVIRIKQTAIADELSSAAELVIGQTNEAVPAAIIRGYNYQKSESAKAKELMRPKVRDIFL